MSIFLNDRGTGQMKPLITLIIILCASWAGLSRAQTLAATAASTGAVTELNLIVDATSQKAYILMAGPSDRWFAWGFGGTTMANTYAIVVDGTGQVLERMLGNHNSGSVLSPSFTLTSQNTFNGRRYLALERPLAAASGNHFTFTTQTGTLDTIWGVGSTSTFTKHPNGGKDSVQLSKEAIVQPKIESMRTQTGSLNMTINDLTVAITNHVEFTSSLTSGSWSNLMDLVHIPLLDSNPTYNTNMVVSVQNFTNGFIRIRH
jgi:hypothetical protein